MAKTQGQRARRKNKRQQRSSGLPRGVALRPSGKYGVEIKNPITQQREWLGTFPTVEDAENAYKKKASVFERELDGCTQAPSKSVFDPGASSIMKIQAVEETELLPHAAKSTEDCSYDFDIFKDLPDICSASELHLP